MFSSIVLSLWCDHLFFFFFIFSIVIVFFSLSSNFRNWIDTFAALVILICWFNSEPQNHLYRRAASYAKCINSLESEKLDDLILSSSHLRMLISCPIVPINKWRNIKIESEVKITQPDWTADDGERHKILMLMIMWRVTRWYWPKHAFEWAQDRRISIVGGPSTSRMYKTHISTDHDPFRAWQSNIVPIIMLPTDRSMERPTANPRSHSYIKSLQGLLASPRRLYIGCCVALGCWRFFARCGAAAAIHPVAHTWWSHTVGVVTVPV